MSKKIKLMADYHSYPLWDMEEVGNIDPNELPLSTVLKKHLQSWAECYDETLVIEEPRLSGFKNELETLAFEEQGKFLWQQIQKELGKTYEIFYFSHWTSKLLKREDVEQVVIYYRTEVPQRKSYTQHSFA
jgi:hypothetical protein